MSIWTTPEREQLRKTVRSFTEREILPNIDEWERTGDLPRDLHRRAGAAGLLGAGLPDSAGGGGGDGADAVIICEEFHQAGGPGGVFASLFTCGIAVPHIAEAGDPVQIERWVRPTLAGDKIGSLAVTEPDGGSDVAGIRTTAVREGDEYVVNGAKTFISNGAAADLVILAVKTDPDAGRRGISLLVVDTSTPGFARGRKLDKLGLRAQDLAEISFTDMRIPVENLLGVENEGFTYLTSNLAQERLSIAVNSQAAAAAALSWAVEDHRQGANAGQEVKFTLGQCAAEVAAGQSLIDQALLRHVQGRLSGNDAAIAKLYCTELQGRVVDRCLALSDPSIVLRGDSRLGNAYLDGRVSRIYGGSSEIMKVIIGQSLGL